MTPAQVGDLLRQVVAEAVGAGDIPGPVPVELRLERPKSRGHGDYATPVAMQLARSAARPPREVAESLAARLRLRAGIGSVEVAGPGFLNITLDSGALGTIARAVVEQGAAYGRAAPAPGRPLRVNLEFVSANPTGPVHIGAVRWAAVGDALGRLLRATGAEVTREYYFNDAGAQIDRFAASLAAVGRGEPVPEDGYAGTYVDEIAGQVLAAHPGLLDEEPETVQAVMGADGVALMLDQIKSSLADLGVTFDVYFLERSLHESGALERAVQRLRDGGHVYDHDGALWLRTTDFGDDRDRVLIRSTGEPTYFNADAAYYLDKRSRGFDKVVIMLGADHHGYVGRLRAMASFFGDDPDQTLEVLIGQMVNLVREGSPVRMSKRAGTYISLEDLLEAVGADAARYALARASTDSAIDLDLDLLTRHAAENPVYYVQYAATRSASILRHAAEMGIPLPDPAATDLGLLTEPEEVDLLGALGEFPSVVAAAAELRAPHRVARYLEDQVAPGAQRFFDKCRVLPRGDEEVTELTRARLLLWQATRVVLENGLGLLGVRAPERM
jgi:arginyl-tRNA synthetase